MERCWNLTSAALGVRLPRRVVSGPTSRKPAVRPHEWPRALAIYLGTLRVRCPRDGTPLSSCYECPPRHGRCVVLKCALCARRLYVWVQPHGEPPALLIPGLLAERHGRLQPMSDLRTLTEAVGTAFHRVGPSSHPR